jgi:hypothetical protein
MNEGRALYEGEFEHSGSGRTVTIDVDLEHYDVGGGILILSLNGCQAMSSWPDTVRGAQSMIKDLETIKQRLLMAQKAVHGHLDGLLVDQAGSGP